MIIWGVHCQGFSATLSIYIYIYIYIIWFFEFILKPRLLFPKKILCYLVPFDIWVVVGGGGIFAKDPVVE